MKIMHINQIHLKRIKGKGKEKGKTLSMHHQQNNITMKLSTIVANITIKFLNEDLHTKHNKKTLM
jgi:hypothetical protein